MLKYVAVACVLKAASATPQHAACTDISATDSVIESTRKLAGRSTFAS